MPNNDESEMSGFTPISETKTDTTIERIDVGIEGLDAMIEGGVPRRSLMVTIGGPGTGKTTFGQQFINHGLEQGERGVYLSLEESRKRLIRSAVEKGWDFDEYVETGQLAIIDLDPVEMATRLGSIRNELPEIIEDFGAERVVLDSVSLLELMFESPAHRRNQIYDFTNSLKLAGVTTLLTSEAREGKSYTSKYELVEYLTDVVFVLRRVRETGGHDSGLAVEIIKIRDANHERDAKPMELTESGIEVYQRANIF